MTGLGVRAAAWHLPERTVPVTGLAEFDELSGPDRDLLLGLGIDRVHADDAVDAVDLAARAAVDALAAAGLDRGDVDALVVIESRAPEAFLASEATRLQAVLGLSGATTFTVGGLGCASIAAGLLTARGLLAADEDLTTVLVAHGSKPVGPARYRHPVTVNGDGGLALVVGRDGPVLVRDILLQTSGEYWDLFRVPYRDRPTEQWREECSDLPRYSFELALETRNRLRTLHRRLLDRNGLAPADVTRYFSQNLSAGAFRFYEESLDITIDPVCRDNLRRFGHLGSNDTLVNLYTAAPAPEPEHAVLLNVSPAAAWSAVLITTGDPAPQTHHLF